MREKSCLTNLISIYLKVTHLGDQGKAVDVGFFFFFWQSFQYSLSQYSSWQNAQHTQLNVSIIHKQYDFILL